MTQLLHLAVFFPLHASPGPQAFTFYFFGTAKAPYQMEDAFRNMPGVTSSSKAMLTLVLEATSNSRLGLGSASERTTVMEATLCLKSPRSTFLQSPRNCFLGRASRTTGFPYGGLHSITRAQTHPLPSSVRPPEACKVYDRSLASVVGTAAVAAALACAGVCIGPSWSKTRHALAAPWFNIPIQGSADRGQQDGRRDSQRSEQQKKSHVRSTSKVIFGLSDEAWDTLVSKWKELKQDKIKLKLGFLLVDIYITKGNAAAAQDINERIKKMASPSDQRPQIRSVVISMISKDGEKKKNWEKFAQEIQEIANSPFSSLEEPKEEP
ncbi:hypothetical protein HPP92_007959 [Vanilla planifolia]|uniref:Uncharacterized protein n=1 Tax=Vanilla planifolia TaxID=51239 RepID=A0A835VCB6_VANPL|nr:hypothetical protein HPP92_007959 [Vanilla planifolia]